ncbi:Cobalamin biosynthesis protein BluB @ 5,6-dimethylbenzimidazole synthase, flavin destructase family [hydrothermal vent metagenome]|uniref:Cobalamin biosynthesis protein BluB @ 5,6-dimethylbenzimidazole synthase, flavin destructase family n=1 Tax=hydrothermal vent metagenome TaxID=652676 RepID=A0A1W1BIQ0_9ZZZZ
MNFTEYDAKQLLKIMKARRDVRGNRFISKKIEPEKLKMILEAGISAPSVGYSQPWKFIIIKDQKTKEAIKESFDVENEKAKAIFKKRALYNELKLEGIAEAPINIAVLYEPKKEKILGMTSMKKMGEYSVVCAVENMWLMARALNIGIGWVSILDEKSVLESLHVKNNAQLIAYLCVGYVDEFYEESELKTLGWEREKMLEECVRYQK